MAPLAELRLPWPAAGGPGRGGPGVTAGPEARAQAWESLTALGELAGAAVGWPALNLHGTVAGRMAA